MTTFQGSQEYHYTLAFIITVHLTIQSALDPHPVSQSYLYPQGPLFMSETQSPIRWSLLDPASHTGPLGRILLSPSLFNVS